MILYNMWTRLLLILSSILFCQAQSNPESLKRSIFLDLEEGAVRAGDVVIVEGRFRNRIAQLRFISKPTSCTGGVARNSGRTPQCHPLVVRFYPLRSTMKLLYKGEDDNHRDVELGSVNHSSVTPGQSYRLQIKVGSSNYTLVLNGETVATIQDKIGHEDIIKLRAYGGYFSEYYLDRNDNEISADTCGTRPGLSTATLRIIGGTKAKAGEYPWQVALRRKHTYPWANYKHMCGASLIRRCWVLTAAHCLDEVVGDLPSYSIRVGDYNNAENAELDNSLEDQQDLEIEQIFMHPAYATSPSPRNDIALVRLNSSTCARFSDFVRPVCLPNEEEEFPVDSVCEISGWGALHWTDSQQNFPNILQKAPIRISDHDRCRESYGLDEYGNVRLQNETVCASERGIDACQGDSGGPLVCQRNQISLGTNYVLWGVTSWGDGCASEQKPGIYTKVVDYLDWIKNVTSSYDNQHD